MHDEPDGPRDDPARSWDDGAMSESDGSPDAADASHPAPVGDAETVGTGSYVAVSCVAGMGLLLVVLILGLLVSRWIG